MGQMDCSMVELGRMRLPVCLLGVVALAWAAAGCGDDAGAEGEISAGSGETRVLGPQETMQLLRQLPYRYKFKSVVSPEGADAAVAGRAVGPHRTILNFGIALGHGHVGVPVTRAGTAESYGYPRGGFIFTSDEFIKGSEGRMVPNPQLHTAAQWREASHMEVTMTDRLCLAATGGHCPP
jgi:hypothetical protein